MEIMGKQKTKKAQKRDTLDKETLEYYQRISHELKQDISDEENKGRREKSVVLRSTVAPHVMVVIVQPKNRSPPTESQRNCDNTINAKKA